jgi:hypothetical protein
VEGVHRRDELCTIQNPDFLLYRHLLTIFNIQTKEFVEKVYRYIMATKSHRPPEGDEDPDLPLFLGAFF